MQLGNLALAIVTACSIQLVVSGLFTVMVSLEDPFARRNGQGYLDGVKVPELVEMTRRRLLQIERDAALPW